jgi:outer membrane protein assembly factor BamB
MISVALVLAMGCGKKEQKVSLPKKDERLLWDFETGSGVTSSPAIGSDGTVYVGSRDNKEYALKTDSKGLAKSPWPMRGQNARRSGRAPAK